MADDTNLVMFQEAATEKLEEFQTFIQEWLPQKGRKVEDCQRTAFEAELHGVQALINGTVESDLRSTDAIV